MDWLTGIFDATLTGGITGLVGTVFTGWMTFKEKAADRAHQVVMRNLDMEERKIEADLAIKHVNAENEGKIALAEMGAFSASFGSDRATYSVGSDSTMLLFVDAVRGLMRPILTMVLVVITGWLTFEVVESLGGWGSVKADYARTILDGMINTLLFCTATAVTWWFGSRALGVGNFKVR